MKIQDIAKLANVSVATVSRVINNGPVSEKTRKIVEKVIKENDYKPNLVGRSLRKMSSEKLLVMLPTISNPFYSDIVVGFEEQVSKKGYGVLLVVTHRNPAIEMKYYELLFTRQIDGVVSFIPTVNLKEIGEISKKYPYVACCWHGGSSVVTNYVCIDNEKAAYDATKYLIENQHTKIAILNGDFPERIYEKERESGYIKALTEYKIPVRKEYSLVCDYNHMDAYNCTKQLLTLSNPPTAILAMSDERAAGIIKYLSEKNMTAGKDIDVIGFDNLPISQIVTPEITTISQPRYQIGVAAADLLLERLENNTNPHKGIILAHELIIRDSTRNKVKI